MNRVIKFRAWDADRKRMAPAFDLSQNPRMWWKRANQDFPLMQFTGLTDKNGKEIYEGDILKHPSYSGTPLIVDFAHASFGMSDAKDRVDELFSDVSTRNLDVIGNIYENPELLKDHQ